MKEVNPILTAIISIIIMIFFAIPVALNMYIQDMKYKETKTEYRRDVSEFHLDRDDDLYK